MQPRRRDELFGLAGGSSDGPTRASERPNDCVAADAPYTEVRSRSGICVCVSQWDWLYASCARGRCPRRGLTPLPGWVLGLGFPELTGFCISLNFSASGARSAAVFVHVFRHEPFVEFLLCSLVSFGLSISIWLARSRSIGGVFFDVFGRDLTRKPPPLGVRCVLFSGFAGVVYFSSLNQNHRCFCAASPLVALLLTRLAIRSGQNHPGLYTQPHQPDSG